MAASRHRIIAILVCILLGAGGWFGYALWRYVYVTVPNAYAVWNVADLLADYMDMHDGAWPHSWDDLRKNDKDLNGLNETKLANLQDRVEVDWNADPSILATLPERDDGKAPFRVIWLRNGTDVYWSGASPNRLIQFYLQRRIENPIRPITPDQLERLRTIPASTDGKMEYHPCRVTLRDGRVLDRVYIAEAKAYRKAWRRWPTDETGMRSVAIEDVVTIEESPLRLPVQFANRLYQSGETGSGYVAFTIILQDGRHVPCITGHAVDFPAWPSGITPNMVSGVLPETAQQPPSPPFARDAIRTADFLWCPYRLPSVSPQ